jgi:hypothetical protein
VKLRQRSSNLIPFGGEFANAKSDTASVHGEQIAGQTGGKNDTNTASTEGSGRLDQGQGRNSGALESERNTEPLSGDQRGELSRGNPAGDAKDSGGEESSVAELNARNPSSQHADKKDPRYIGLRALLDAFHEFTGKRGYIIDDPRSDGVAYKGNIFVSINKPHMHVGWTIGHEFKHLTESHPGLKALYDSIWALIDNDLGKRRYFAYVLLYGWTILKTI